MMLAASGSACFGGILCGYCARDLQWRRRETSTRTHEKHKAETAKKINDNSTLGCHYCNGEERRNSRPLQSIERKHIDENGTSNVNDKPFRGSSSILNMCVNDKSMNEDSFKMLPKAALARQSTGGSVTPMNSFRQKAVSPSAALCAAYGDVGTVDFANAANDDDCGAKEEEEWSSETVLQDPPEGKERSRGGPLRSRRVYGLGAYSQSNRVLLCMVGLPARGKSYITKLLQRYLIWSGFPVRIFNAGELRRQEGLAGATANFFKDGDREASALRERVASACMEEAIHWLQMQSNVCVAIFDATNTTVKRRRIIYERCKQSRGVIPVFVESICDNAEVLEENYKLKLGNDDYCGMDPEKARADFLERIKAYETRYETLQDDEHDGKLTYIKLFNVGQKVAMYHCSGYLVSQIGFYLSNIHIQPRSIWLTQHAELEDVTQHQSSLTLGGKEYCSKLASFLTSRKCEMLNTGKGDCADLLVLMGTATAHEVTFETMASSNHSPLLSPMAERGEIPVLVRNNSCSSYGSIGHNDFPAMSTSLLNEMDRGDYRSAEYKKIKTDFPELWAQRERENLHFRYPGTGGESYADVIGRLRPIIIELERQRRSVLVISHLAVQRCLYAYFTGCPMDEMPNLEMEQHCVIELLPGPFGCQVTRHNLDPNYTP